MGMFPRFLNLYCCRLQFRGICLANILVRMGDAQSRRKRNLTPRVAPRVAPTRAPTRDPHETPMRVDFTCSALEELSTKAPTKRLTKVFTEVPTKSVHSSGRDSLVLFSPVLFLDHRMVHTWEHPAKTSEYGSCTVPSCVCANFWWMPPSKTQLTRQPPQCPF